jgi:hypothetical protein
MIMSDTDRMPLDGLHRDSDRRHKFFRFDPTVSTGTLLQIGVLVVGASVAYGTYREDRTQIKADIDMVKVTTARDREDVKTAIEAFRVELRGVQQSIQGANESLAVLKAQVGSPQQAKR